LHIVAAAFSFDAHPIEPFLLRFFPRAPWLGGHPAAGLKWTTETNAVTTHR
jgi:hypothetical protein